MIGPTGIDSNWMALDRGRFTFYVRPGSFAAQTVDTMVPVLDDQFASSVRALDLRYDGRITFFLHNSGAEAGFGDDAGGGDGSGAAYPMTETVKTVVRPPLDAGQFGLLTHEMNHVIIRNGLGSAGTAFVNEGLASAINSERFYPIGRSSYYRWTADNRAQLPPLATLVEDSKWTSHVASVARSAAASFLAYLLEQSGHALLRRIYYASSKEFRRVFRDTYGRSLEDAEAAWLRFCESSS